MWLPTSVPKVSEEWMDHPHTDTIYKNVWVSLVNENGTTKLIVNSAKVTRSIREQPFAKSIVLADALETLHNRILELNGQLS